MAELIEVPQRMRRLPVDKHGRVVPFFVAWVDGVPDHRIADADRLRDAIKLKLCSLCGGHMGRYSTFVLGPMCTVTRTAPEPPSHLECATYAAIACPFLATPRMRRRDTSLPEGHTEPGGVMLRRNPGVTAVWTSRNALPYSDKGKPLFDVGDPTSVSWYAEGRPATRDEVLASLDSGMPGLREMAETEGPRAVADLKRKHNAALRYLPCASDPNPGEI